MSIERVWETDLTTIKPPVEIQVPRQLVEFLEHLSSQVGFYEFSLFLSGGWTEEGKLLVESWVAPSQEVTPVSVVFNEASPDGFSGVLHRHPAGCSVFSSVDEKYINQNHSFSLLYISPSSFPDAVVNVPLLEGKVRVQLEGKVRIIEMEEIAARSLEKIYRLPGAKRVPAGKQPQPEGVKPSISRSRVGKRFLDLMVRHRAVHCLFEHHCEEPYPTEQYLIEYYFPNE